jgi:ABC-type phosphate/phosphonate transport system substrate-binding protein
MTTSAIQNDPDHAIGSLPMYDFAELRSATDRLWDIWIDEMRTVGIQSPTRRTVPDGVLLDHWRLPHLMVSQSCGYPFRRFLTPDVALVGTFAYRMLDHGPTPTYRSQLVARADNPRGTDLRAYEGADVVINGFESLSGCVSLGAALVDAGITAVGRKTETGAHAASLKLLRDSDADLAAIDGITWSLLSDVRPAALDGLMIIGEGPTIPCLPIVTAHHDAVEPVRAATAAAVARLSAEEPHVLLALRIGAFAPLETSDYDMTLDLAQQAALLLPVAGV